MINNKKQAIPNYTYNHSQRWLTDLYNYNITGTMISYFNYTYDYAGNRLTIQQGDGQAITDTLTYEYDRINQLTLEQRRNISNTLVSAGNWQYDEVGNRTNQDKYDGSITTTTTYSYNNANQLTSETTNYITTSYAYDGNGNMNGKSIYPNNWVYAYDYENHLVSYTDPVTSTNNSSYTYDALGRRTTKTVNSVSETYFYDGANVIEDYNVTGTMVACYLTPFLDQNILISTTGASYYYFQDGLGSVRNLIDSVSSVANTYDYTAFGESYGILTQTVTNRYKFTGREWDTESSQYYYRARYYTPTTGRFGGRDPIEYDGGINLYSYVGNNPVISKDPYGLFESEEVPVVPGPCKGAEKTIVGIGKAPLLMPDIEIPSTTDTSDSDREIRGIYIEYKKRLVLGDFSRAAQLGARLVAVMTAYQQGRKLLSMIREITRGGIVASAKINAKKDAKAKCKSWCAEHDCPSGYYCAGEIEGGGTFKEEEFKVTTGPGLTSPPEPIGRWEPDPESLFNLTIDGTFTCKCAQEVRWFLKPFSWIFGKPTTDTSHTTPPPPSEGGQGITDVAPTKIQQHNDCK